LIKAYKGSPVTGTSQRFCTLLQPLTGINLVTGYFERRPDGVDEWTGGK
jgi:hypothetical protein